jgi:hypothetical protein
MARTIWSAFGDPDGTVVAPIDPEFASFASKTAYDERNGFAPIWSVKNEKAFRPLLRQVRNADQIILGHRDEWCASVTEESLRMSGITAPMHRVLFRAMDPTSIRDAIKQTTKIDRSVVDLGWRRRLADRIVSDAISRPLKKLADIDWSPTLRGLALLGQIGKAGLEDQNSNPTKNSVDLQQPTMMAAILRGSKHNSPVVVANQIRDLIDYGLMTGATDVSVKNLREWCLENLGDSRIDLDDVDASLQASMLIPMDASVDLRTVQPTYQQTYTDIWRHAVHFFSPTLKVDQAGPVGQWRAEPSNLFPTGHDPLTGMATLAGLRDAGLVFGWSYLMLTDLGMLALAVIEAGWPLLGDTGFLSLVCAGVDDLKVSRQQSLGALLTAARGTREVGLPDVMTLCPSCRGALRVTINQRRLRLVCQNSGCSRIWPCERNGKLLRPLLQHKAPRWCNWCGLTVHDIDIDETTRSVRQTCKQCGRNQTY